MPWPLLADLYTPALALAFVLELVRRACGGERALVRRAAKDMAILLVGVYGLMLADTALRLWPRLGLDYSTHTALSLALVIQLSRMRPRLTPLLLASLGAYCALMLALGYHSIADMVTTALVVAMFAAAVRFASTRRTNRSPCPADPGRRMDR